MAAHRGVSPRNLSRFKLTHAAPAGGPWPCHGELAPLYGGDNIAVDPRPLCLSFGRSKSDGRSYFFSPSAALSFSPFRFPSPCRPASLHHPLRPRNVNDRAVKRRMTGATPVLTNRRDVGCQSVDIREGPRKKYILFREPSPPRIVTLFFGRFLSAPLGHLDGTSREFSADGPFVANLGIPGTAFVRGTILFLNLRTPIGVRFPPGKRNYLILSQTSRQLYHRNSTATPRTTRLFVSI